MPARVNEVWSVTSLLLTRSTITRRGERLPAHSGKQGKCVYTCLLRLLAESQKTQWFFEKAKKATGLLAFHLFYQFYHYAFVC